MRKLGENITNARLDAGLLQTDLARRVGYSSQLWSAWERGTREISALQLLAIARALKTSVDVLLEGV